MDCTCRFSYGIGGWETSSMAGVTFCLHTSRRIDNAAQSRDCNFPQVIQFKCIHITSVTRCYCSTFSSSLLFFSISEQDIEIVCEICRHVFNVRLCVGVFCLKPLLIHTSQYLSDHTETQASFRRPPQNSRLHLRYQTGQVSLLKNFDSSMTVTPEAQHGEVQL